MARRSISIEEKIEAQKELVSKAKDRYEAELDKLEKLMRKRDELRSKEPVSYTHLVFLVSRMSCIPLC